jgi:hypothetical protein
LPGILIESFAEEEPRDALPVAAAVDWISPQLFTFPAESLFTT